MRLAPSFLKFLIPIVATAFIYSCVQQKELPQPKTKKNTKILLVAWNEDTLNSYHIVAFSNGTFYYGIRIVDSTGSDEFQSAYTGKIKYGKDSVYLSFDGTDNHNPLAPYLVVEASGRYLIQYLKDSKTRHFLRLIPERSQRHKY